MLFIVASAGENIITFYLTGSTFILTIYALAWRWCRRPEKGPENLCFTFYFWHIILVLQKYMK
jgi:hypothetical protein